MQKSASGPDPCDGPFEKLKLEGVGKRVGDFVLMADFEIPPGGRAALVGRSGSGKTTLLRVIAGLEKLDEAGDTGRIWIGKREITSLPPQERQIGFVFQEQALFSALDVLDNVTFGLRMRGVSKEEREARALPWLRTVGLEAQRHSPVGRLSGGEAQRVAFIRALIWRPQVILLDEPFSALDSGLRSVLRTELLELHRLWPVPLILVTHDAEDLQAVASTRLRISESLGAEGLAIRRIQVE